MDIDQLQALLANINNSVTPSETGRPPDYDSPIRARVPQRYIYFVPAERSWAPNYYSSLLNDCQLSLCTPKIQIPARSPVICGRFGGRFFFCCIFCKRATWSFFLAIESIESHESLL